jgi:hypothetical protein
MRVTGRGLTMEYRQNTRESKEIGQFHTPINIYFTNHAHIFEVSIRCGSSGVRDNGF